MEPKTFFYCLYEEFDAIAYIVCQKLELNSLTLYLFLSVYTFIPETFSCVHVQSTYVYISLAEAAAVVETAHSGTLIFIVLQTVSHAY